MKENYDLPVIVGGLEFKNPFFVASGPTTKSVKQLLKIEKAGWAAASIKLSIDPYPYINKKPRYSLVRDRDALCFTAEKRLSFKEGLKLVGDAKKQLKDLKLFANITYVGKKGIEGWVNMARKFEEAGADVIELNMCCPNMSYNVETTKGAINESDMRSGASLGQNESMVSAIVKEVKESITIPLFVKLTTETNRIADIAYEIHKAGADAVGGTGSRLGMPPINIDEPCKAIYHLQEEVSISCYCGPWLKPLAQKDTYEIRNKIGSEAKIMATGGIRDYKDSIEMIMCGADLIGVCTETLLSGYDIVRPIISSLKNWMGKNNYTDIGQFKDKIIRGIKPSSELTIYDGYARIINPTLAAPCKVICPYQVPVQGIIRSVAKGNFEKAYNLACTKAPLLSICTLSCPHPCEKECVKGASGNPLKIRQVIKFILDYGKKQGWNSLDCKYESKSNVAVIGSGASSINCAYQLAKAGYNVTMFEKEKVLGGMMRYSLPKEYYSEIENSLSALKDCGVEIITERQLDRDFTISSLKQEGFRAIYLGIGAQSDIEFGIKNYNARGIYYALDFIKRTMLGENISLGKRTLVVGDGSLAIYTARYAVNQGIKEVFLLSDISKGEHREDLHHAKQEGIKIITHAACKGLKIEDNLVAGAYIMSLIENVKTGLLEEIGGSQYCLECDTVIFALGRKAKAIDEVEYCDKYIKTDNHSMTNVKGVFAGGDATGVANIAEACRSGNNAAADIDIYLNDGIGNIEKISKIPSVSKGFVLRRVGFLKKERQEEKDIHSVMNQEAAVREANRCLSCGCGEGCEICKTICIEEAIYNDNSDSVRVDEQKCIACGMCYNMCPNNNIKIIRANKV